MTSTHIMTVTRDVRAGLDAPAQVTCTCGAPLPVTTARGAYTAATDHAATHVVHCEDGAGACAAVWTDCCDRILAACKTSDVPEAGVYCNDGHGCRQGLG